MLQNDEAIRLYQALLRFHQPDADPSALIDADLERLAFGNSQAFGEDKSRRYQAALERFADTWRDHEIVARALHARQERDVAGLETWLDRVGEARGVTTTLATLRQRAAESRDGLAVAALRPIGPRPIGSPQPWRPIAKPLSS